jgi:hypothetical protein
MNIERTTCGICGSGFDLPEDDKPRQPGLPFAVCSRPRCGDAATILGRTFTILRAPRPHRRSLDYAQRAEELLRGLKTFTTLDKQSAERWYHDPAKPDREQVAEALRTAAEDPPRAMTTELSDDQREDLERETQGIDDGPHRVHVVPDPGTLTEKGIAERVELAVNAETVRAARTHVDRLTHFLYILMRDEIPSGAVRKIQRDHMDKAGDRMPLYSEAGLAMVARSAAAELLGVAVLIDRTDPCPHVVIVDGVECCGCPARTHAGPGPAGDGRDSSYPLRKDAR